MQQTPTPPTNVSGLPEERFDSQVLYGSTERGRAWLRRLLGGRW